MSNYYSELKDFVREKVGKVAARREAISKELVAARKKLTDEQAAAERVQEQIGKLKGLAGQSLAEGQNAYEGFKTSLRKRTVELQTLMEIIETLKNEVIPGLERSFSEANQQVSDAYKSAQREKLPVCQGRINANFERHILEEEYDAWVEGWDRLCGDFGESFSAGRSDLMPGLFHPRLSPELSGLVAMLPADERILRLKQEQKA